MPKMKTGRMEEGYSLVRGFHPKHVKEQKAWGQLSGREITSVVSRRIAKIALVGLVVFGGIKIVGERGEIVQRADIVEQQNDLYAAEISSATNDDLKYKKQFLEDLRVGTEEAEYPTIVGGSGVLGWYSRKNSMTSFINNGCLSGTVYDTRASMVNAGAAGLFSSSYLEAELSSDNGILPDLETRGIRVVPLNDRIPSLALVYDGERMQPVSQSTYDQIEVYGCNMSRLSVQDNLVDNNDPS